MSGVSSAASVSGRDNGPIAWPVCLMSVEEDFLRRLGHRHNESAAMSAQTVAALLFSPRARHQHGGCPYVACKSGFGRMPRPRRQECSICATSIHCCVPPDPGSDAVWPRSSPSRPQACRPPARRPIRCGAARRRVFDVLRNYRSAPCEGRHGPTGRGWFRRRTIAACNNHQM